MAVEGEGVGLMPTAWVHARGVLSLQYPQVMAILNVTPDSFYDGGRWVSTEGEVSGLPALVDHARQLVRQGAQILDVGGESTRPGSQPVPEASEHARVLPVIEALVGGPQPIEVPVSIDTRRATTARAALVAGASIVNDVSTLADPEMLPVVADSEAGLVIGHLRGEPQTMQDNVSFVDLLGEVTEELAEAVERAVAAGIVRPRIVVDPGIGFGKTAEQSAALVASAGWLRQATGCAVLIGASRKGFLGAITQAPPRSRLAGSLAAALVAVARGASVLRVHDVPETAQALAVARSIHQAYERHADGSPGGVH